MVMKRRYYEFKKVGSSKTTLSAKSSMSCSPGMSGRGVEADRFRSSGCRLRLVHQLRQMRESLPDGCFGSGIIAADQYCFWTGSPLLGVRDWIKPLVKG